jgi:glycosyltransferase involved in cell wall biosynthesis
MGQQVYEEEIASRAQAALGDSWDVRRAVVRSLRAPLPGTLRVPSAVLSTGRAPVRRLAGALMYRKPGLVHRLDLRLPPAWRPEVLTIHDVVPLRFADEAVPIPAAAREAKRALAVVCPSQFSAEEIHAALGVDDPVVIPNGVAERFFGAAALSEEELARLGVRSPYVLHAGGSTERKNLAGLAGAWALVRARRPELSLVMLGPPDPRRDRLFRPLPGTVLLGRVSSEVAVGVMAAAAVIVVPSIYEGFGLPALEAMAVGVPVVAARRASLPEVCGDAAILVEPDAEGLAAGLVAVLEGGPEVAAMVSRGRARAALCTWEATLAAHARLWRRLVPAG